MPTAVVQIDIEALPAALRVDSRYTHAMVIARRKGKPVAQAHVGVHDGAVDTAACAQILGPVVSRQIWAWKVDDYLGPPDGVGRIDATVAICTRERPDDLHAALAAVAALDPAPTEIIVIDNCPSTPRTREVVAQWPGVRYVVEPRRGLDAARNRALREASTTIVAFTDDDATPESDWLAYLLPPFDDPLVWCASGLTLPLELETPAQEWFERYSPFGRGFERRVFDGTREDPLAVARAGAGANMAVRTAVLHELGGFDEALDAGTPAQSGGDHEMFSRILSAGYRIVYEPGAVSAHRHRRTWEELRNVLHGYGVGVYAMWTRKLIVDHEIGVFLHAWRWFRHGQLRHIWRTIRRRPAAMPRDLLLAELTGCLAGPLAYLRSRRQARSAA